jgi:hypothetical protein
MVLMIMSAIADYPLLALFAVTEEYDLIASWFVEHGFNIRAFVTAIAKGGR